MTQRILPIDTSHLRLQVLSPDDVKQVACLTKVSRPLGLSGLLSTTRPNPHEDPPPPPYRLETSCGCRDQSLASYC